MKRHRRNPHSGIPSMWNNHHLRILFCIVVVHAVDSDSTVSTATAPVICSAPSLSTSYTTHRSHAESTGLTTMLSSVRPEQTSSISILTIQGHTDQTSTMHPNTSIIHASTMAPATTVTPGNEENILADLLTYRSICFAHSSD